MRACTLQLATYSDEEEHELLLQLSQLTYFSARLDKMVNDRRTRHYFLDTSERGRMQAAAFRQRPLLPPLLLQVSRFTKRKGENEADKISSPPPPPPRKGSDGLAF